MGIERIIELLRVERACVASDCPEKTAGCAGCRLAQDEKELLEMYDTTILLLETVRTIEAKFIGQAADTAEEDDGK